MIETNNLTKIFKLKKKQPDIVAVDQLSLSIKPGEVFGFLGPNGAGKTTTVRMLASLIAPTAGTASVNGLKTGLDDTQIRRSVGILTETPGMYERLSAEMNLAIFAELYDVADVPTQVEKYLRMLGLWERRADPVGSFSKGMRQKLAIARAMLHEPAILFLDEPTSGLDPEAAKMVREFVETLKEAGRTIFLCTHNLDEADRLCDRIGIFKTRLIALDTPQQLRESLFGRKVVFHLRQLDPAWVDQIKTMPGIKDVQSIDARLIIALDDPDNLNPQIVRSLVSAGADIQYIGEIRHSLEDIYLQTIHRKG